MAGGASGLERRGKCGETDLGWKKDGKRMEEGAGASFVFLLQIND